MSKCNWKLLFIVSIYAVLTVDASIPSVGNFLNSIMDGMSARGFSIPSCVTGARNVRFYLCSRYYQKCWVKNSTARSICLDHTIQNYHVLVHGFAASADNSNWVDIKDAFLNSTNGIVLSLQWAEAACSNGEVQIDPLLYPFALKNVPEVTDILFKFVRRLIKECNMSLHKSTIVGSSIGAHIAGFVGKRIQKTNDQKFARIIGLDPAGPGFMFSPPQGRLDASDAIAVDIIHTSNKYGLDKSIGTSDFYINGGDSQPECNHETFCSHKRSVDLYKEDLEAKGKIIVGTPWDRKSDIATVRNYKCAYESSCCSLQPASTRNHCKGDYYVDTCFERRN